MVSVYSYAFLYRVNIALICTGEGLKAGQKGMHSARVLWDIRPKIMTSH